MAFCNMSALFHLSWQWRWQCAAASVHWHTCLQVPFGSGCQLTSLKQRTDVCICANGLWTVMHMTAWNRLTQGQRALPQGIPYLPTFSTVQTTCRHTGNLRSFTPTMCHAIWTVREAKKFKQVQHRAAINCTVHKGRECLYLQLQRCNGRSASRKCSYLLYYIVTTLQPC
jgi:hypothetical protein